MFWKLITELGDKLIIIPIALFYYFSSDIYVFIALISLMIIWEIIWSTIKLTFFKDRPIPMPYSNIYQKLLAWSFPSIHTIRTFSMFIFSLKYLWLISIGYFWVYVLVATSRVVLKKHFIIDILWGTAIVWLLFVLYLIFSQQYLFFLSSFSF